MSKTNPLLRDWQNLSLQPFTKKADAPTAEDIEKVFSTQAYSALQQKAPQLMEPQNRIGFEVVYKNSPTNSRLVGMFGFRLNGKILYVPCFFLNGQIKGIDLLHRVDVKKFVPLTESWVEHLDKKDTQTSGEAVSRGTTGRAIQTNNLERIANAPNSSSGSLLMFKGASVNEDEARSLMQECWNDWETKQASFPELLPEFVKDVGLPVFDIIEKAAANFNFAEALHCSDAMARIDKISLDPVVKSASKVEGLTIHTGLWSEHTKVASEEYYDYGFCVEDGRAKTDRARLFKFEAGSSISSPGVYDITAVDGEESDVLALTTTARVGELNNTWDLASHADYKIGQARSSLPGSSRVGMLLITTDGRTHHASGGCGQIFGAKASSDAKAKERLKDKPTTEGAWYPVYADSMDTVAYPLEFAAVKTSDGVTSLSPKYDESRVAYIINPDAKDQWEAGVFGKGTKWLQVKERHKGWSPLPASQFTAEMLKLNHTPATLTKSEGGFLKIEVRNKDNTKTASFGLRNKVAAAACLADKFNIYGPDAALIANTADREGRCDFIMSKAAHVVRVINQPNFVDSYNSTFGVLQREPQSVMLATSQIKEPAPKSQIGDGWDPSRGAQVLLTKAPMELYEFARSNRIPALFDHAVVGSLAKTFDAGSLVDKYVPKLEDGVDALGRMLFLLYWKPEDFKDSYGADDLQAKENEILSNFKSLGSITLELLKRNKSGDQGSQALVN